MGHRFRSPHSHTHMRELSLEPPEGGFVVEDLSELCDECEMRPKADPRGRYCATCRVAKLNERVSRRQRRNMTAEELAAARGRERKRRRHRPETNLVYGARHQKLRGHVKREVDAGRCACWRCGEPIVPGEPWDLGHVDGDPSRYAGPEHRACNRATAKRDRRSAAA